MIHVVVALAEEARPLLRAYKLQALPNTKAFRIYVGHEMRVIVSGVGKTASAAAVGYLEAAFPSAMSRAWVNFGVAGHRDLALGTTTLAHKVLDEASGRAHFPVFTFKPTSKTHTVCTRETVTTHYSDDALCDLEASAMLGVAIRFSTAELVHCIKVISDNATHPASMVTGAGVEELMTRALPAFENLRKALMTQCAELHIVEAPPPFFLELREQARCSVSEEHQLRRLLQRAAALGLGDPRSLVAQARFGKDMIRILDARLANSPLSFEREKAE